MSSPNPNEPHQAAGVIPPPSPAMLRVYLQIAEAAALSGYFKGVTETAQALTKMLAGREYGIGPIRSLTALPVVDGKLAPSADLMAECIARSGRYKYRVVESTKEVCRIDWYEREGDGWAKTGQSEWTIEEAKAAGLLGEKKANWKNYASDMLFSRCLSRGRRRFAPDVLAGSYTPEELGAEVDEAGEIADVENGFAEAMAESKARKAASAPPAVAPPAELFGKGGQPQAGAAPPPIPAPPITPPPAPVTAPAPPSDDTISHIMTLARQLHVDRAWLETAVGKSLETMSADDAQRLLSALTAEGARKAREMVDQSVAAAEAVGGESTDAQRAQIKDLLERLMPSEEVYQSIMADFGLPSSLRLLKHEDAERLKTRLEDEITAKNESGRT